MKSNSKISSLLKNIYTLVFSYQQKKFAVYFINSGLEKNTKKYPQFKNAKKDIVYLKNSKQFINKYFPRYNNTNWHHFYSTLSNTKKVEFIPNDLFFTQIEPTLNKTDFSKSLNDKLSYDLFFQKENLPTTWFKIINGMFYNLENRFTEKSFVLKQLTNYSGDLVLKPAEQSGGGKNVVIEKAPKIAELLKNNREYLKGSYIIQERINQHQQIAKFHPASVNTCRIMTARVNSEIVVLTSYIRFGRENVRIDNGQAGGIKCNINKNGKLADYAIDNLNKRYKTHPDTGIEFSEFVIPGFNKVVDFCKTNHKLFLRLTLISWDIAINENCNPVFIEFNLWHQSILHQILTGPLFGEYTEYFLAKYCEELKLQGLEN